MTFHFYSPRALEPWDWRNPDEKGIGNSETSHIEMALRLAKRGHDVVSYTKLPDDMKPGDVGRALVDRHVTAMTHGGVSWRDLSEANFGDPGVWALYRCPEIIERFTHRTRPDQQVWIVVQDTYFSFTAAQAAMVDKVLVLCEGQKKAQAKVSPAIADKLVLTSNGIRVDMIEDVEREFYREQMNAHHDEYFGMDDGFGIGEKGWARCIADTRNPHRIHFSSSPDRGLGTLLRHIFPRVREYVTDAELHVYYGIDNIEALKAQGGEAEQARARKFFAGAIEAVGLAKRTPGVTWHGRIGQRDLTREWLKAGVWVYPNTYPESSCATSMEAQALGAFPVAHPLWGVAENVKWGTLVPSTDPHGDRLTHARYASEVVRLMLAQEGLELDGYRASMMADARQRFSWDRFAAQWEQLAVSEVCVAAE